MDALEHAVQYPFRRAVHGTNLLPGSHESSAHGTHSMSSFRKNLSLFLHCHLHSNLLSWSVYVTSGTHSHASG